ncbi:FAD-dependent oxidoreductase [uncultured Cohaesibacter sp.]|uniref:FAD-dependent oxidoreductase n=1 Tax=uncultured Cohaesibacter sp. TaxID=1002546 RepID=UPI0029C70ADE|nr:FAD-dependent oxidoreductase [uncultured Cohaesibacter sp.]
MSISVFGGGLTGCLIALELAEAGKKVVLFEKEAGLLRRASHANEGKIHLGFVYAADESFRTARRMIDDALQFRPVLERWIASRDFDEMLYDRFDYLVPQSSMLSVEAIEAHFALVSRYLEEQLCAGKGPYLGQQDLEPVVRRGTPHDNLQAAFTTPERGIWPDAVARVIGETVASHPNIEIRTDQAVLKVEPMRNGWRVLLDQAGARDEGPFEAVVNCAWAGRRRIDAASGHGDGETWFYRYKFGVVLKNARQAFGGEVLRNSTAMLGAYGDSVYHEREDSLYCSWYPVGMCFSCEELVEDRPPVIDDPEDAMLKTWEGYASMDPAFKALVDGKPFADATIVGDFIAARAKTDIQDPKSKLHERHGYGAVELAPGYWSVETGKYTSAPRCADACSRMVLGR